MTRFAYRQQAVSTHCGAAKAGVGLRTKQASAIVAYLSFMRHLIGELLSWRFIAHLSDQFPPATFFQVLPLECRRVRWGAAARHITRYKTASMELKKGVAAPTATLSCEKLLATIRDKIGVRKSLTSRHWRDANGDESDSNQKGLQHCCSPS